MSPRTTEVLMSSHADFRSWSWRCKAAQLQKTQISLWKYSCLYSLREWITTDGMMQSRLNCVSCIFPSLTCGLSLAAQRQHREVLHLVCGGGQSHCEIKGTRCWHLFEQGMISAWRNYSVSVTILTSKDCLGFFPQSSILKFLLKPLVLYPWTICCTTLGERVNLCPHSRISESDRHTALFWLQLVPGQTPQQPHCFQ